MSSILTNNSAMVALQTLRNINSNLETVQSEISTGKKVATAKDNAAIWAISTVMSTDVESFNQITDSLNKGSSTVGVARAASEQVTELLQDMKNLIVSAQEDLNADDRAKIQTDIDAKRTAISNIVNAAQFNGQNLLQGTESISILASLDRGSDGSVSATSITVARQDLQTTAAVDAAAKEATDAGYVSTADSATDSTVDLSSGDAGFMSTAQSGNITDGNDADITLDAGTVTTGDEFTINVGGSDYTYTALEGDTANDVAAGLKTLIDAGSIANLTVTVTPGADPASDDATINLAAAGGNVTFDETGLASETTQGVISDGDTIDVTLAGGTITAGDTFTINVGDAEYTYTAVDGDTNNDVAAGLKTLIDAGSISDLVVTVTDAGDPTSDAATISLEADGGDVNVSLAGLGSQNAAVAAGGLGAIADLSVATAEDATTALNTIEDLLDTAINAATSFGSAQTQIEGQGEFVQTLIDSMTSGIGAMVDADIEAASAKLQALQVQQQLGVQALSIANSNPQTLLSLFR
ncbi:MULTISPECIES: flagellin [Hyphomonas]|nr:MULTISPECIES: flagellin [Hyphomonas]|tara:strand:- start:2177 stop:3754 length:1578 start_codon:yes stop_codon:yes gene_type:complete